MQIKHWDYPDRVIYENQKINTFRELLIDALSNKIDLYEADFYRENLNDFDFAKYTKCVRRWRFQEASYKNTNFEGMILDTPQFTTSNLTNANFKNTIMVYPIFTNTALAGANFENSIVLNAQFNDCYIDENTNTKGVTWYNLSLGHSSASNIPFNQIKHIYMEGEIKKWK